jgi:hypothetical protein
MRGGAGGDRAESTERSSGFGKIFHCTKRRRAADREVEGSPRCRGWNVEGRMEAATMLEVDWIRVVGCEEGKIGRRMPIVGCFDVYNEGLLLIVDRTTMRGRWNGPANVTGHRSSA